MPRGGRRVGAGRKKKTPEERLIDGNAGHRGRLLPHPSVPAASVTPAAVEEFDAPNDLTMDERHVWLELAPFAFKNGTLTKTSALAFRLLCRNVVLERDYAKSVQERGGASHRGMIQRVDAELDAFALRPTGKPMAEPVAKPLNPLEKFLNRKRG